MQRTNRFSRPGSGMHPWLLPTLPTAVQLLLATRTYAQL